MKVQGDFSSYWNSLTSSDEVPHSARAEVKGTFCHAGWMDPSGSLKLETEHDVAAAKATALEIIQRHKHAKRASKLTAGVETVTSTQPISAGFNPKAASPGDMCPLCGNATEVVSLVNDREAIYCRRDRVVVPIGPRQ